MTERSLAIMRRLRPHARRISQSLFGASVAGLAAAAFETTWARGAAAEAAPARLSVFLTSVGILAPAFLFVGAAACAFGWILRPDEAPGPRDLVTTLREKSKGRPADIAAFAPLVVVASFFFCTFSAHATRAILAIEAPPRLVGIAIAAASLAIGLLLSLAVLALTPPLRHLLARVSDARPSLVDPAITAGGAVGLVTLLIVFGAATGTISGDGGLFGIYGILKRPELDLRPVGLLSFVGAVALFAPAASRAIPSRIALPLAFLPLVATLWASSALNGDAALVQTIERGAPLGKPILALLQKATDRDKDGRGASFGGGDCDDKNKDVYPGAEEILDNGVDEDCSGEDLTKGAIAKLVPGPVPDKPVSQEAVSKIPKDLNLVILTIDTLRADLGYMGYSRPVSPNLDKLAAKSVVWDRAYSLASYTGKSLGPMLMGKYGSETHRNWGHSNVFSKEDTFLAERLKKAGFRTFSVHAMSYFARGSGLERGFDEVDTSAVRGEGNIKEMENTATAHKVSDAAVALLQKPENTSGRFFMWVHYLDAHADYLRHDDTPSFGNAARDLYDGEIAFVDKHVGRILEAIQAAPWGAKTAILVTSDHGEMFGEHGMWRHGFELWEPLMRVPLILYVPGVAPIRIQARRSAIDVVPTLLDLLGIPKPPHASAATNNDFISGASMLPDFVGETGKSPAERDIFMDMPGGPYNDPRRALIHGDMKYIVSNDSRIEVYDLAADPEEKNDLSKTPARKDLEARYQAIRATLREVRVTGDRKQ